MASSNKKAPPKSKRRSERPSDAKLHQMIKEAIVDAYGESEQMVGFYTMLEDNLAVPFQTEMLGVEVTVERVDMTDDDAIVAVCARGKSRQRVAILDLPLPDPPPEGAEWIDAFRRWARGR
ncbi:MAG TPA: calcium-binding protein [Gemmatimonadota bacterium]|nr:calcium-binding protein [Gemmatimonadota bacterium]